MRTTLCSQVAISIHASSQHSLQSFHYVNNNYQSLIKLQTSNTKSLNTGPLSHFLWTQKSVVTSRPNLSFEISSSFFQQTSFYCGHNIEVNEKEKRCIATFYKHSVIIPDNIIEPQQPTQKEHATDNTATQINYQHKH